MATKAFSFNTLSGVFEKPKMKHRRDFLRENKLSLRALQKTTSQKMTQLKQEQEGKQNKHLHKFHRTQEQSILRRSASRNRNNEQNCRITGEICGNDPVCAVKLKPNYLGTRRAYSQQRERVENIQTGPMCCYNQQQINTKQDYMENRTRMPRCASSISVLSKAESCDKEIQTEDINDEYFLHEALKKCSSFDVQQLQKQKSICEVATRDNNLESASSNNNLQQYESQANYNHSRARVPYNDHSEANTNQQNQTSQYTSRTQITEMLNGHPKQEEQMFNCINRDLDQHFRNLKIANGNDTEPQLSARSRQSSTSTKRSVHKLGNREDVRLPRYLEKEKREKEEERVRELNRDLNCPLDHYALSEEERLKALNKAHQKMDYLINELNHMPMTMETLRIRNRKNEIEKELTKLELDIRLYSKSKVYIPITSTQY